ncbi:MAG: aspartate 1-decarboxylase [Alphaproteobacteria bacterium]
MYLSLLKCKLHGAVVTDANLNYEGSIGIARDLMDKAGLVPHEKVDVLNFRNGARLTTYVIEYPAKSGQIVMNGPASHLVTKVDRIIVCAYASMSAKKARKHTPTIVILGAKNTVKPGRDKTMIDPKRGLKKTVRKKPAKRKAKK